MAYFPYVTLASGVSANGVTIAVLNELGLLFGIMAAAGKFVLLSEDKVIVFSEQIRTRKPNEKRLKRFQEILKT